MKRVLYILKTALYNFVQHGGSEYAGYLAFLLLLSIFPFLFFFTAMAGHIGTVVNSSSYDISRNLLSIFVDGVPENIIQGIMPYIKEILEGPTQSLMTFTILGAVWSASSIVEGMKSAINKAYNYTGSSLISHYILRRLLSVFQFLVLSCTFFFVATFPRLFNFMIAESNIISKILGFTIFSYNVLTTFLMFFFVVGIYKFLPDTRQNLKDVLLGSVVVVLLWVTTSALFSFYLKSFAQMSIIYGSIANIIIVLFFFYIINLCFIYGAEVNAARTTL